jgi:hypothetical protein
MESLQWPVIRQGRTGDMLGRGRLCPKGSASEQLVNSPGLRQGSPLHDRAAETTARRPPRGRDHGRLHHDGGLNLAPQPLTGQSLAVPLFLQIGAN